VVDQWLNRLRQMLKRVLEKLLNTKTLPQLTIYGGIGFVEIGQLKPEFSKAKYILAAPAFVLDLSAEKMASRTASGPVHTHRN
jgi:hypothetical protein